MTFLPGILLSSVYSADKPLPPLIDTLTLFMKEKPVGRMISSLRSTRRTVVNDIALSVTLAGGADAVISKIRPLTLAERCDHYLEPPMTCSGLEER